MKKGRGTTNYHNSMSRKKTSIKVKYCSFFSNLFSMFTFFKRLPNLLFFINPYVYYNDPQSYIIPRLTYINKSNILYVNYTSKQNVIAMLPFLYYFLCHFMIKYQILTNYLHICLGINISICVPYNLNSLDKLYFIFLKNDLCFSIKFNINLICFHYSTTVFHCYLKISSSYCVNFTFQIHIVFYYRFLLISTAYHHLIYNPIFINVI